MKIVHEKEFVVSKEHLDQLNHVNNVQYVHWVEEIAVEHWETLKHLTLYPNDYWVMVDHHIQYKKQLFLGDKIVVRTYPQQPEGIRQPRKVEFYHNGDLVVDSRTLWVLCDASTHKIKRVATDWLEDLESKL